MSVCEVCSEGWELQLTMALVLSVVNIVFEHGRNAIYLMIAADQIEPRSRMSGSRKLPPTWKIQAKKLNIVF